MDAIPPSRMFLDIGHAVRPVQGEARCGDAAVVASMLTGATVALVDGLGHGAAAALAASTCASTIEQSLPFALPAIFEAAHRKLRGTRGAVAAVAKIDGGARALEIAAIGNVTAILARASRAVSPTRFVPVPGVVGGGYHKVQVERVPFEPGDVLILHTDGVSGPIDVLALRLLTAQEAAAEVIASHGVPFADAGCVIVRALTASEMAARSISPRPAVAAAVATPVQRRVPLRRDADAQIAALEARRVAAELGLSTRAQWEVAIAASELATNALKHGIEGVLVLRHALPPEDALVVDVTDRGEGLTDLPLNASDGISGGALVTELPPQSRRGLGVGLGSVYRMMDHVDIDAIPGQGTRVVARKRLGAGSR